MLPIAIESDVIALLSFEVPRIASVTIPPVDDRSQERRT